VCRSRPGWVRAALTRCCGTPRWHRHRAAADGISARSAVADGIRGRVRAT
jgi:hypothetical protein